MSIQHIQHQSLKHYNTFGFDIEAPYFTVINQVDDVPALIEHEWNVMPKIIMGGGSNMLFTKSPDAWIIKNNIKGINVIDENEDSVMLEVAGGEVWHDLVMFAVGQDWGGIENLALIPGTVGAAPMQNIGAYGVEVKDVIEEVKFFDFETETFKSFDNAACEFGYRDSIFKRLYKNKILITSVTFRLQKKYKVNTSYGAIQDVLDKRGIAAPIVKDIASAVMYIRQSKLPDPKIIGNAGSFFKNPVITTAHYTTLTAQYPDIPGYVLNEDYIKVPAGWLIETNGWKGRRIGDVGVHEKQALVLVNYGMGTGQAVWDLSTAILEDIKGKFNIELEREVQVY